MVHLTDRAIIIEIPTEFAYTELFHYQQALCDALAKVHPDMMEDKGQLVRYNNFIGSLLSNMLLSSAELQKLNPLPVKD